MNSKMLPQLTLMEAVLDVLWQVSVCCGGYLMGKVLYKALTNGLYLVCCAGYFIGKVLYKALKNLAYKLHDIWTSRFTVVAVPYSSAVRLESVPRLHLNRNRTNIRRAQPWYPPAPQPFFPPRRDFSLSAAELEAGNRFDEPPPSYSSLGETRIDIE